MGQIIIILTDRDRYFLSILFALAGCMANGYHPAPAVKSAVEAADYLKKTLKESEVDEQ